MIFLSFFFFDSKLWWCARLVKFEYTHAHEHTLTYTRTYTKLLTHTHRHTHTRTYANTQTHTRTHILFLTRSHLEILWLSAFDRKTDWNVPWNLKTIFALPICDAFSNFYRVYQGFTWAQSFNTSWCVFRPRALSSWWN